MSKLGNGFGYRHDKDSPCLTSEGREIRVGMKVWDYDRREAVVTQQPRDYEFEYGADEKGMTVCWPQAGHQGHWWRTNTGSFDGSRMQSRKDG